MVKKSTTPKKNVQAMIQKGAEMAARVETVTADEAKSFVFSERLQRQTPWTDVFYRLEDLHKGEAMKIPGCNRIPAGLKKAAKRANAVLEFAADGDSILVRIREYIREE